MMSVDAALEALLDDVAPRLHAVLRRAYEMGYREGLAAVPGGAREGESAARNGAAVPEPPAAVAADVVELEDSSEDDVEPAGDGAGRWPALEALSASGAEEEAASAPEASAVRWGELDGGSEEPPAPRAERARPHVRIYPHATVGTLRERIVEYFGLERFDIEVILCRPGDPNRRQLKSGVKLSKYLVGE